MFVCTCEYRCPQTTEEGIRISGAVVKGNGQPSANDKITIKAIHLYVHTKTGMKTNVFCSASCQTICASVNMGSRRLFCASLPETAMFA